MLTNSNYIDLLQEVATTKSPDEQRARFFAWAKSHTLTLTADEKVRVYEITTAAKALSTSKTSKKKLEPGETVSFYARNDEEALCTDCGHPIAVGTPTFLKLIARGDQLTPTSERKAHPLCNASLAKGLSDRGRKTYENWMRGRSRSREGSAGATPIETVIADVPSLLCLDEEVPTGAPDAAQDEEEVATTPGLIETNACPF